jgi:hypothetical protein
MTQVKPDLSIVSAIVRGVEPARRPTIAERVVAVRHLAGFGYSDAQIAERVSRSVRQVLRIRSAHGIAGLPVGTNASTRPRQNV